LSGHQASVQWPPEGEYSGIDQEDLKG